MGQSGDRVLKSGFSLPISQATVTGCRLSCLASSKMTNMSITVAPFNCSPENLSFSQSQGFGDRHGQHIIVKILDMIFCVGKPIKASKTKN